MTVDLVHVSDGLVTSKPVVCKNGHVIVEKLVDYNLLTHTDEIS